MYIDRAKCCTRIGNIIWLVKQSITVQERNVSPGCAQSTLLWKPQRRAFHLSLAPDSEQGD